MSTGNEMRMRCIGDGGCTGDGRNGRNGRGMRMLKYFVDKYPTEICRMV